jgi:hypothetical protein
VPDSFGKRNRDRVKAEKAAARDERRVARNQRQKERLSGDEAQAFPTDRPAPKDASEGATPGWDPDAARSAG